MYGSKRLDTGAVCLCASLFGLFCLLCATALGQGGPGTTTAGWGQFRGPERNGVSAEAGLLQEWPENGPELLWE